MSKVLKYNRSKVDFRAASQGQVRKYQQLVEGYQRINTERGQIYFQQYLQTAIIPNKVRNP